MTLYLLKVHLQTFLTLPVTQKCQILSCDTLVANERYEFANYQIPHLLFRVRQIRACHLLLIPKLNICQHNDRPSSATLETLHALHTLHTVDNVLVNI